MGKLKRAGRWTGIGCGGFLAGLAILLGVLYVVEQRKLDARYEIAPDDFAIPEGAEAVAEGERLYHARVCSGCHGEDAGGSVIADMWAMTLAPANLTVVANAYSAEDFARAVRHGVSPSGRPYVHMPVDDRMWHISDRDLGHIIAYLRTLPPVQGSPPATELKFWGMIFDAVGMVPVALVPSSVIDHDAPRPTPPPIAETEAFGRYVLTVSGCQLCHGEHLSGGLPPMFDEEEDGIPANLTPHATGLAGWSRDDFFRIFREGRRPDGTAIDRENMSLDNFERLTDTELGALWLYLQTVEPRAFGNH